MKNVKSSLSATSEGEFAIISSITSRAVAAVIAWLPEPAGTTTPAVEPEMITFNPSATQSKEPEVWPHRNWSFFFWKFDTNNSEY